MVNRRMASPFPTGLPPYVPPSAIARRRSRDQSAPAGHVGQQLRQLRQSANLAAGALARSTGVSRSMLSRIERGLVSPSIETLRKLAIGLGVPMSQLFSETPNRKSWCHVPAGNRLKVDLGDAKDEHRHELLGHLVTTRSSVQPYFVTLSPSGRPFVDLQLSGIQFVYVVSGSLRYRYGRETVNLQAGDSMMFEASIEHGAEAVGHESASFLSVGFLWPE